MELNEQMKVEYPFLKLFGLLLSMKYVLSSASNLQFVEYSPRY